MNSGSAGHRTGYHYTTPQGYESMKTPGMDGYFLPDEALNEFTGLVPQRRFIPLGRGDLPDKAYEGVIEGLLEPRPSSWTDNSEFPDLWRYLMHDVCLHDGSRDPELMLISFPLHSEDDAYVVERAYMERELYREANGKGTPTPASLDRAAENYWDSRVPVDEYDGGYDLPQLTVWSGIPVDRLRVEWRKPQQEVWGSLPR